MKNLLIVFAAFSILFMLSQKSANAQIVEASTIQINAGTGFAIHGTTSDDPNIENDAAVSGLLNASAYYSLTEKWALGVLYERNGFATDQDSSEAARSSNVMLGALYRIRNGEKSTIAVHLLMGGSKFRYEDKNDGNEINGSGFSLQIGLGWKHYLGQTFGIFADAMYSSFNYDKFEDDDGNAWLNSEGTGDVNIDFSGAIVRVGVTMKL